MWGQGFRCLWWRRLKLLTSWLEFWNFYCTSSPREESWNRENISKYVKPQTLQFFFLVELAFWISLEGIKKLSFKGAGFVKIGWSGSNKRHVCVDGNEAFTYRSTLYVLSVISLVFERNSAVMATVQQQWGTAYRRITAPCEAGKQMLYWGCYKLNKHSKHFNEAFLLFSMKKNKGSI